MTDREAAWCIFLKHLLLLGEGATTLTPLAVCAKLLACSRSMAHLVHATCTGRLQASAPRRPPAKAQGCADAAWCREAGEYGYQLAGWLSKHAALLHTLELSLWPQQEAVVAGGLLAAARQQQRSAPPVLPAARQQQRSAPPLMAAPAQPAAGLPLVALSCTSASDGQLLASVAGLHLTHLELHLQLQEGSAGPSAQQRCAALAGLQDLQRLTLAGAWCGQGFLPVLGPALRQLTKLTSLHLPRVSLAAGSIDLLPGSLQELRVCCHSKPLRLERLTALRSLHLEQQLHEAETLPPSLTAVWLGRCEGVTPLLALPDLRWLRVDYDLTPEQLQELSGLSRLSSVQLSYFCCTQGNSCDHGTLAAAAGLLHKLPLKQLKVLGQWGCGHLPAAVAQRLGGLTQLTCLSLQDLVLEVEPQEFGAQLQQLLALEQLELRCLQWQPQQQHQSSQEGLGGRCECGEWGCSGSLALARVLGGLPSLREVCLVGMLPGAAVAAVSAQLRAAPQLTRLDVGTPSADEVAVCLQQCCSV